MGQFAKPYMGSEHHREGEPREARSRKTCRRSVSDGPRGPVCVRWRRPHKAGKGPGEPLGETVSTPRLPESSPRHGLSGFSWGPIPRESGSSRCSRQRETVRTTFFVFVMSSSVSAFGADPFADRVVEYEPGAGVTAPYNVPTMALGSPERFTGEGVFPSAVTPFNPPFNPDEIVSIGAGGWLTVAFDEPVVNDPLNPFGIDLLIFGNAFFIDASYPDGVALGLFGGSRAGRVEVSPDGNEWRDIFGVQPVGMFPNMGYADITDPYSLVAGALPTDFTKPVNPAFDPFGKTYAELVSGYAGSGGGVGIDLASTGFAAISYVRISNAGGMFSIDAISDVAPVPTPGVPLMLGCAGALIDRKSVV